jgi:hypothetical protein
VNLIEIELRIRDNRDAKLGESYTRPHYFWRRSRGRDSTSPGMKSMVESEYEE